ncbi:MAG: ABC transporter permease [Planctomycetes bacterium]|nr:ABC transporter permease [Planctomycetota bacterium]
MNNGGESQSYWAMTWTQLKLNRQAMAGLYLVGAFFLLAFFTPFIGHNLPIYWTGENGITVYPLVQEFFAPQETTEKTLEASFNFLLLFLPISLAGTWIFRKLMPELSQTRRQWVSWMVGGVCSLMVGAVIAYVLIPGKWSLQYEAMGDNLTAAIESYNLYMKEFPSLGYARLAILSVSLPVACGFIILATTQTEMKTTWLVVVLIAAATAAPFVFTKRVKVPDPSIFRMETDAGKGHGLFPLIPYGPTEQGFGKLLPPTWYENTKSSEDKPGYHLLGTDALGRDIMVRIIHGARVSLSVGFVTVAIYTLIGLIVGSCAGYFGGMVDMAVSRLIEIMMCFPTFFLILAIIAIIDERSIFNIMLVLGLTGWTGIARLIRGEVLKQKKLDYVASAQALGAGSARIMFRHILPNAIAPVLVSISFGIAGAILTEAGLSFLGFGVSPPTPTWGILLNEARREGVVAYWWLAVFPGILIFLSVTAYNLVGEGLRDAMDPRLRK